MGIAKIVISNLIPLLYLAVIPIFILIIRIYGLFIRFSSSSYSSASGNRFYKTISDKGAYGEFLVFLLLESLGEGSRILTNIYLPLDNGRTTEIDLLMVHPTGIYVFESKNYSGWIFGDEKSRNWTQSLKGGKKISFYNPVMQNRGHINALMDNLRDVGPESFFSYIVFSERCELKNVSISSKNTSVLKRNSLKSVITADISGRPKVFGESEISGIHGILSWYSLAEESIKVNHVRTIREDLE
ncbi:nuclease-related domain-containing protein [Youngiibacter multivorans]|uniref:NERD domain-containing protein n=1 Tax=Youngiibacter multivorans TaxID=937251 RepID=A0ABS4G7Q2_9CLOT|nr:nuclease-related domain-containing protein [Youngiibacter multivorans]MBP1920581.1 hypothetical protein [Youngiibacter multivorans]